ncbi:hypothetical protein AM493_12740 [Flavobacterium akiainvivens]|uniref:PsbP C-terminal domain-containing protein n=1 Tax=Flavobacterium akiainvivens TaxID=1202724 RepID=A0A0M8MA52_9FLAO|nr:hypothetical protein [Flavobacterium akiainvivens]KOS06793.1 hypothetical protein AM493_12740 [Flavobacterium akiainvivens]SFQ78013.1 hypothetical protein SAMN05444144_1288 [Flavobacterium akiainvivens]
MKKVFILLFFAVITAAFGQERYTINAFGFSVQPPADWFVTELGGARENLDKFDLSEEQRASILKDYATVSGFAAFYKYDPKKYAGIIPTVNVVVKPLKNATYEGFKKLLESAEAQYSKVLENYKTGSIKPLTFPGGKAWEMQSTYDFKNPAGEKVFLKSRATFFYCDTYYINLNYIEEVGKEDNTAVYDAMLKTVVITPKK